MEDKKEKRQQHHYYATSNEYEMIVSLASKIGKTEGFIVRTCVLAVANNPLLEYIFDDGVLLKADAKSLRKYSPTLRIVNEVIKVLEKQGIYVDIDDLLSKEIDINKILSIDQCNRTSGEESELLHGEKE